MWPSNIIFINISISINITIIITITCQCMSPQQYWTQSRVQDLSNNKFYITQHYKCHLYKNLGLAPKHKLMFLLFEKCLTWPAYWTRLAPCQRDREVLGCAVTLHNIMVRLFTRWINLLQIQSFGAMFFPPLSPAGCLIGGLGGGEGAVDSAVAKQLPPDAFTAW